MERWGVASAADRCDRGGEREQTADARDAAAEEADREPAERVREAAERDLAALDPAQVLQTRLAPEKLRRTAGKQCRAARVDILDMEAR